MKKIMVFKTEVIKDMNNIVYMLFMILIFSCFIGAAYAVDAVNVNGDKYIVRLEKKQEALSEIKEDIANIKALWGDKIKKSASEKIEPADFIKENPEINSAISKNLPSSDKVKLTDSSVVILNPIAPKTLMSKIKEK